MTYSNRFLSHGLSILLGGVFLTLSGGQAFAGSQTNADAEVAQQMEIDHASPFHFSLSTGAQSEFVFRGVDILPAVDINVAKVFAQTLAAQEGGRAAFIAKFGETPIQDAVTPKPKGLGKSNTPVEISHESGIVYTEGTISAYSFTLGAFYATQIESREDDVNKFLIATPGNPSTKAIFDEYREFDAFLQYSHRIGPVTVSSAGTVYHVVNNTDFNTAEFSLGVSYTPPNFPYVAATFSYDYDAAFDYTDYRQRVNNINPPSYIRGDYLDGNYLEARLEGNIPLYKHVVMFAPYLLVSAGSGILPRAFNSVNLPTYINNERYAKASVTPNSQAAAFDPSSLDRSFDLSNFQAGFRVPIYLTRYISVRGDFNYSRPLGNLDREPYNQKDQVWGGGSITLAF